MSKPWPTEIRLKSGGRELAVAFNTDEAFELPAELLRVRSPSAEVQGHSPEQKQTVPGKKLVRIVGVDPVGNYAVRLTFDDGHDTGLYSWDLLVDLGRNRTRVWAEYLDELAAKGLSREPA